MATVFRNLSSVRKVPGKVKDRENLPPVFGSAKLAGKENVFSERRHAGRKQAFGEIKNVLHNSAALTPMKTTKLQVFSPRPQTKSIPSPRQPAKTKKSPVLKKVPTFKKSSARLEQIRTVPNVDLLPKPDPDYNDLEYVWSQQSRSLADRTMSRFLRGGNDADLLLPLPDISAMETFETVFGEIEPIAVDHFVTPREHELPPLPTFELEDMLEF